MPKLVMFDPKDNNRILQWLDTDAFDYNLPDSSLLHECTEAEWDRGHDGEMMVSNGKIGPYVAPAADQNAPRRAEIMATLAAIDAASSRPARAVALALASGKTADPYDVERLADLDAQAVTLRAELHSLESGQ